MTTRSLLDAALYYAGRGWPVLALAPRGKTPLGKACPHGLKDATTAADTIRQWWSIEPEANVGIVTGARAGFWVLDIDAGHGGDESLDELTQRNGKLPDTVESLTGGGGRHLLFAWPSDLAVRNTTKLADLPGLDLRGEGGYIVAPPSLHPSGNVYAWELSSDPRDGVAIAEAPAWLLGLIRRNGQPVETRQAPASQDAIPDGQRNQTLTRLAGAMRRQGATQDEIYAALQAANRARCVPPLEDAELRKISGSVARYEPAAEPEMPPTPRHTTDLGNAQRLVALHGSDMRYCYPWGKWLLWDGRHWVTDTSGAAERLAKATVQEMYAEAGQMADEEARKALAKHALKSESQRSIAAMLALAQSEDGIPVQPSDLDANPWLLNCLNGTINLRTGELRPHAREDLLTKVAPAEYDPGARSELWERFLTESTGGDAQLMTFLQRAAGYSLTGETDEEKLFFVHGPGAAGKSTFLEALKAMFGGYAATADFETFLARQQVGQPRADVAQLAGARLVVGIEVDEGKKMAEGLVKQLTGGDTVTARFLYRENFTFRPQMKLWLAANHAPKVSDSDDAMWRRILRVPFERVVPEEKRDPELKRVLRDPAVSGPAILAWAVRGCLDWQREGLGVPPVVKSATDAYRLDNDPLRDFIAVRCIVGPTKTVSVTTMATAYKAWHMDNGEIPISNREFNRRLEARGCRREHSRTGTLWVGIGLMIPGCDGCDGSDEISVKVELVSPHVDTFTGKPSQPSLPSQECADNQPDPAADRGQWHPPADIQAMIQEVFGEKDQ